MSERLRLGTMEIAVLLALAGLLGLGLTTLARIGLPVEAGFDSQLVRQSVFAVLGVGVLFVMAYSDYRALSIIAWALYWLGLVALVLVLFFGVTRYGSQRWFLLGPIQFQPSELAKFTTIVLLARYFARRQDQPIGFKAFLLSGLIPAGPVFLIFIQPDLGTALIFVVIWLAIAFIGGARLPHLGLVLILGLAAMPLAWFVMKPYMRERIVTFFDPTIDPLGAGYNVLQARIAVGSGGWWGRGIGEATQSQLEFLRVRDTDFIFAVVAEQLGFVGALAVLTFFTILLAYALVTAVRAPDDFGRFLAGGVLSMLSFEVFISIGMNIGIAPVTGIALPMLSSGGSSLVMTLVAIGAVMSVSMHKGLPLFNPPTRIGVGAGRRHFGRRRHVLS